MSVNAKILKSLQFYQDNDMNELYGTKDDIELQKKLKLSINLSAKKIPPIKNLTEKTSSAINSFKKNPIERIEHQESKNAPNETAHQYPIQKTLNNSQPIILNTDQAIFKLANLNKNNQQNPEKFIAINDIISEAKKLANCAQNIEELRKIVENFDGCNLKKMATNTVFSDGNVNSKIMIIGEAPGNQEDLEGIPFCGDSGEMLTAMLAGINLFRQKDYYITNVIFWRPPGNRKPTSEELAICRPFLERHIELFDPKIIILIGATAMGALIETKETISNLRGKIIDYKLNFMDSKVKILTIFHPSFLMRQPLKKKIAWLDMQSLKKFTNEINE